MTWHMGPFATITFGIWYQKHPGAQQNVSEIFEEDTFYFVLDKMVEICDADSVAAVVTQKQICSGQD